MEYSQYQIVAQLTALQYRYRIVLLLASILTMSVEHINACVEGDCFSVFKYFTIQSNWFVLFWLLLAVLWMKDDNRYERLAGRLHLFVAVYITVTFLIFATLLSSIYHPVGFINNFTNIMQHYILPNAFDIDFFMTERQQPAMKWALQILVYPILYLVLALTNGAITGNYLYPFLDLTKLGVTGLLIWVLILMVLFMVLCIIFQMAIRFLCNWHRTEDAT